LKPKKVKNRDNISKIIFRKKISHLGFREFLLGCAAPSPDPTELDPAAWLSIPPAAKKKPPLPTCRPNGPRQNCRRSAAIAQGSTTEKNGVPGLRCLERFGGGRNEGEAGKEVEEHGEKLGPCWYSSCEGYKEGGGGGAV